MTSKQHMKLARKALKQANKHLKRYVATRSLNEMKLANGQTREVQSRMAQARFVAESESRG